MTLLIGWIQLAKNIDAAGSDSMVETGLQNPWYPRVVLAAKILFFKRFSSYGLITNAHQKISGAFMVNRSVKHMCNSERVDIQRNMILIYEFVRKSICWTTCLKITYSHICMCIRHNMNSHLPLDICVFCTFLKPSFAVCCMNAGRCPSLTCCAQAFSWPRPFPTDQPTRQ